MGSSTFGADAIGSLSEKAAPAHAAPVADGESELWVSFDITETKGSLPRAGPGLSYCECNNEPKSDKNPRFRGGWVFLDIRSLLYLFFK